jgi:RNA polymerase sigma-70 factor (ECF subfamily)
VPEPVAARFDAQNSLLAESLTQAFLLLLERLTPDERAAFLLRVVFDYEYAELAEVLGKSQENVRQLVSRARTRVGLDGNRRFSATSADAEGLAERFLTACRAGDIKAVEAMLAETAELHSDGGGKVSAARVVIHGRDRVARCLVGLFRKRWLQEQSPAMVNGDPGLVFRNGDQILSVMTFRASHEIQAVYITVNPDKLVRWAKSHIR